MTEPNKPFNLSASNTENHPARDSSGEQLAEKQPTSLPCSGFRFPKSFRLRNNREFNRVFEQGAFATDNTLVLHAVANNLTYSRIGLSISKRTGNAPVRNYWKRCLREAYRLNRHQLPIGVDIVVRPRRGAQPDFKQIQSSLVQLAQKVFKRLQRDTKAPDRPS